MTLSAARRGAGEASGSWQEEDRLPTVLLVDEDPEARYGLHASLGKIGQIRVVEAGSGAQALDVLATRVVDVIVSGVRMADIDGLRLLEHVRGQEHLAPLPFLIVADDDRIATKLAAFERGATDYVAKPYAMAEVVARIEAALRRPRAVSLGRRREGTLAGDFSAIAFTDLIHLLQIGHRTGSLALLTPRSPGHLVLVDGKIYHATFGSMEGEEAFYRLMFETVGLFEFTPGEVDLRTVRNTIALSPTALLMEGARRLDSVRKEHPDEAQAAASLPDPSAAGPVQGSPGMEVRPESRADEDRIAELLRVLDDEGRRGRLEILCRDRIAAWTAQAPAEGRCHVLLVSDLRWATEACLALSEPVGPADLQAALSMEQKVLALSWRAPSGATLDVLVLDQEYPGFVLDELRRRPSVLAVAPRGGDWFALSMLAQSELEAIAAHLRPAALLGIGNTALEEGLRYMQQRTGLEANVRCLEAPLESGPGLRVVLIECLRAWSGERDPEPAAAPPARA